MGGQPETVDLSTQVPGRVYAQMPALGMVVLIRQTLEMRATCQRFLTEITAVYCELLAQERSRKVGRGGMQVDGE